MTSPVKYFVNGSIVNVRSADDAIIHDHLPVGTYVIKRDPMGSLYFQKIADMEIPTKVYGKPQVRADRIIQTFLSRPKSTGVLLNGDKGSGKTLLSKVISSKLRDQNIATIVVNEPYCDQGFFDLIASVQDPAMIIFDEFEKTYCDSEEQQKLLTLFDGTVNTKKLFVLTTNMKNLDDNLINRPGRMYYSYSYSGLTDDFVTEYCQDALVNKDHTDSVISIFNKFSSFTFDMLQCLIEEMNRYSENAVEAAKHLNLDESKQKVEYQVTVFLDGIEAKNIGQWYTDENPYFFTEKADLFTLTLQHNPGLNSSYVNVYFSKDSFTSEEGKGTFVFTKRVQLAMETKKEDINPPTSNVPFADTDDVPTPRKHIIREVDVKLVLQRVEKKWSPF